MLRCHGHLPQSWQWIGVAAAAKGFAGLGDWSDGLGGRRVAANGRRDHVGLGKWGLGAVVGRGGGVGASGGPGRVVHAVAGRRAVVPGLVATAAGSLQEPGGGKAQRQPASRDKPGLAAGNVLHIPEQPLAIGITQVAAERLGPVGNLLSHPGWGVLALAPQLLSHAAHVLHGRLDLLASLSGTLVDLVTEPAAGLA